MNGKQNLDVWLFHGAGIVTDEQEGQMTTLMAANVHPMRVRERENGSDDLDHLIAKLVVDWPLHKNCSFRASTRSGGASNDADGALFLWSFAVR